MLAETNNQTAATPWWRQKKLWLAPLLAIGCPLVAGCSNDPPRNPVSGVVRLDGEPLPYGTLRFLNGSGGVEGSCGIGPGGEYAVELGEGRHAITVFAVPTHEPDPTATMYEGGVRPGTKLSGPSVPGYYGDLGTTPLTIDVVAGENRHDIVTVSKRQARR